MLAGGKFSIQEGEKGSFEAIPLTKLKRREKETEAKTYLFAYLHLVKSMAFISAVN